MPKKLTIEEMHEIAKRRNGKCLSKNYINVHTKLTWQCKEGHKWDAKPTHIIQGSWCPYCAGNVKRTIEDMQQLAKQKGGKCLSKTYVNCKKKLTWQCSEGHIWEALPSDIKNEHWCPRCAIEIRNKSRREKYFSKIQNIAKKHGGKCLSDEYINAHTKLTFQCEKGHTWEARPSNIGKGSWCPYCARNVKFTIEDMKDIAQKKGIKILSEEYINAHTPLKWECSKGHVWETSPTNIKKGQKCPLCFGGIKSPKTRRKINIEYLRSLAEKKEGLLISNEYKNAKTKLTWQCSEDHTWNATYSSIEAGHWCPKCSRGLSERICREYFEIIFQQDFPSKRPKWLLSEKGYRMELDGYNEKLNLAFEYQGEQHYKKIFYSSDKRLKNIQYHDELKKILCRKKGVILIDIPYTVTHDEIQNYIIEQCRLKNIELPKNIEFIDYKLLDVYSPALLKEMQDIAKIRGGKCLSDKYIDCETKLKWQCVEGHIWEALPYVIKRGSWCPYCAGKYVTIENLKDIAIKRGGKCLSDEYIDSYTHYKWQCENGHIWKAFAGNIKKGRWCPYCARKAKLTLEEMQKIAIERGGKCLSKNYINIKTKMLWQCSKGHIWEPVWT